MMNGHRELHDLWEEAVVRLGEDAPTQDDMVQLLSQLHTAGALQTDRTPDIAELDARRLKQQRQQRVQRMRSPLAVRIPLFDPDRMLSWLTPRLNFLFSWYGLLLWVLTVGTGLLLAAMHWTELTDNLSDRVLMPSNLVLLGVVYPIIKAFHELGHGIVAKKWGAEVHEIGVMLLVFFPVPYVDASASSVFENRWHRILVSSAGILVELFLAALALFVWLAVEPGVVSAVAYNVILVGGVSTVLVNGNPLLRFDGYFVLSDLLEIPNLGARANQQVLYLVQKYLLRMSDARSAVTARGENAWLPLYAVASFCYRLIIVTAIALFIAGKYFFIGVILASWVMISVLIMPLWNMLVFLLTSPRLRRNRSSALTAATLFTSVILLMLFVPLPSWTNSEGVVWLPESAFVRADSPGFVKQVAAEVGLPVKKGALLFQSEDEQLVTELATLDSRVLELELMLRRNRVQDLVQADIVNRQLEALQEEQTEARERFRKLEIHSQVEGVFYTPSPEDLAGRFVRRGELLGYVLPGSTPSVRVLVSQDRVALVRDGTREVKLMLTNTPGMEINGKIIREIPEATRELPSLALTTAGGGDVAIDPGGEAEARSFLTYFVFDIAIDGLIDNRWYGQRVHVRFEHSYEPLAFQLFRKTRQLFLRSFSV